MVSLCEAYGSRSEMLVMRKRRESVSSWAFQADVGVQLKMQGRMDSHAQLWQESKEV